MFKIVKIYDLEEGEINEDNMILEDGFFFTMPQNIYYELYDENEELIGTIPYGYNLFFKFDEHGLFEDIDIENLIRLTNQNSKFYIAYADLKKNKIKLLRSDKIKKIQLKEQDENYEIPFTNYPFESDGVIVFKNLKSLADSLKYAQ
jgi:hypothetical protein